MHQGQVNTTIKILALLADGDLPPDEMAGDSIYEFTRNAANWPDLLKKGQTLHVRSHVWDCTNLSNSQLVERRVRDAVCDVVRDARGERPAPPSGIDFEDLPLQVTVYRDHIQLYRNLSGMSLHRRGFKKIVHKAALNESAAAGILYLAGWDKLVEETLDSSTGPVLVDPMCGSGTFLVEAAMMARAVPPGSLRESWVFQRWPDYDREQFDSIQFEADEITRQAKRKWKGQIRGNEIHPTALRLAHLAANRSKQRDTIKFHEGPCGLWIPDRKPDIVVVNPPWGERLTESEGYRVEGSWVELGNFLRQKCQGATAYVLSGNSENTRHLGMRASRKFPLVIGGVQCRLLKYDVHDDHGGQS
eukprot:evm.model.scf_1198EXC.3 EVM.evm.TU.scf_1198EXC.3   scf_1198EXC:29856-37483(+)